MSGPRGYPQRDYRGGGGGGMHGGMGGYPHGGMPMMPVHAQGGGMHGGGYRGAPPQGIPSRDTRDARGGGYGGGQQRNLPPPRDPRDRRELDRGGGGRGPPPSGYHSRQSPPPMRRDGGGKGGGYSGSTSPPPRSSPTPQPAADKPAADAKDADARESTASPAVDEAAAAAAAAAAEEMAALLDAAEAAQCLPTATCAAFHSSLPLLFVGDDRDTLTVITVGAAEANGAFRLAMPGSISDIVCRGDAVYVACDAGVEVFATTALHAAIDVATAAARAAAMMDAGAGDDAGAAAAPAPLMYPLDLASTATLPLPDKESIAVSLAFSDAGDLHVGDSAGQVWRFPVGASAPEDGPRALHRASVTGIAFSDDRMITASADGTLLFSPLKGDAEPEQLVPCALEDSTSATAKGSNGHIVACGVNCIDIDSDGLWLAVGGDVPYVSILCLTTRRVRKIIPLPCPEWKVRSITFRKADVLVGVDDAYILTYSLSGKLLGIKQAIGETVSALAVAENGAMWAASGRSTDTELFR